MANKNGGATKHAKGGGDLSRGYISAADGCPSLARTLLATADTLAEAGESFTVFDDGMTEGTVSRLQDLGVDVRVSERGYNVGEKAANLWRKPLRCIDSPYEQSVWIDADAILLEHQDFFWEGPFVTCEASGKSPNTGLYRPLIKRYFGKLPDRDWEIFCIINTGVLGFSKDDKWIYEWSEMCKKLLSSPDLLKLSRCADQDAMILLLLSGVDEPKIVTDPRWNMAANRLPPHRRFERKQYAGPNLKERVMNDHGGAFVVHWMDYPKVWPFD